MNRLLTLFNIPTLFFSMAILPASGNTPPRFYEEKKTEMAEWEQAPLTKNLSSTALLTPGLCTDVLLLDTTYDYAYVNGLWQYTNMNVFIYTPAGLLTNEYQYRWLTATSQWENDKWYTYTYNAAGDMTIRYRYDWRPSLGIWENEYQYTNTYDASHRRTQSIRKDWDTATSTWNNAVRYIYTYQGSTDWLTERLQQVWLLNAWKNDIRYTYTNSPLGLRLENAIYLWNTPANAWMLDSRYLYTYNAANCLTIRTYQIWSNSAWVLDNKYEYTYNAQNYEIQWVKSVWNNSTWSLSAKENSVWFLQNAAPTSTTLSNSSINSTDPIGTLVGNFSTTDPDDNLFTYTFVAGPTGLNNNLFTINGPQLRTNANFADSTASQFFILVQISDGNGGICQQAFVITVQFPIPVSIAPAGPFCQSAGIQTLTGSPAGGTWGGVANPAGQINPASLSPGTHTVTYTYTAPNGQSATAEISITILANPVVGINPVAPFCESAPLQTLTATPVGGTWGGVANTAGQINPAALGPGTYTVTYSYTNASGCTGSAQASISILPLPTVSIAAAGPFCQDAALQTLTASPAGGTWGGVANAAGQIDPAALGAGSHTVTYSFTGANGCSGSTQITVTILANPNVTLPSAGPFCQNAGVQTLTVSPTGGTWGGAANTAGQIDPAVLGAGSHTVTYSFTNASGCSASGSMEVVVNGLPNAAISGSGSICEGSGDEVLLTITASGTSGFTVNYAIDGNLQPPVNFAGSPFILSASTPGVYLLTAVTDANGCTNNGSGEGIVEEVGAPTVSNLDIVCDNNSTTYTVSFDIGGGDPASYTVSGSGTLGQSPPFTFTSNPIASGNVYFFEINDVNNCHPLTLSGSHICSCPTSVGTMDLAGASVCAGETAVLTYTANGQNLDANDTLLFVLHNGTGNALGTVFATNDVPEFSFATPMQYGVTYRVSAVVGDQTADGVDLNDPCLSVSLGAPVVFNPLPTASLSGAATVCEGGSATLVFNLSGIGPFDVTYSAGASIFTLENIYNGYPLPVSPLASTVFGIVSVADGSSPTCTTFGGNAVIVTVNSPAATAQTIAICEGESVVVGGAPQTTAGVYTDLLTAANGCDSIVTTTLMVNALDTTWLFGTSCVPGEAGVFEALLTNQHGCDSLVIETIVFQLSDTTYLYFSSCNPLDTGTVTGIFTNQNGCDSLVLATTVLLPADTTLLHLQSCNPQDTGTVTSIFTNQNGCDSLVFQVTTLLPSPAVSMEILSHYHGFNVSCTSAADGVAQVTTSGGTSPFSYGWQNGQQTPVASQLGGGAQAVTVTDANGCQVSGSVTLTEPQPLVLSFLIQDLLCTAPTDGWIEADATGGAGSYTFALNDGTPQASGFFPIAIEGAYKVEAQDVNGCESSEVVVVGAPEPFTVNLGPDVEIEEGDSVAITATIPEIPIADIASVSWSPVAGLSCQDCLQPTAKPTESTTYTVIVTSKSGCTASGSVTVTVKPKDIPAQDGVYIPTAFSPNDDGINDIFTVYGGPDVAEIVFLRIFTRKGDQVFELRNAAPNQPAFGWDGYFRGEKVNPGVFAWTAVVRFADGHTQNLKGDVALLR